ncbi:MAG: DUF5317 domain-containing protein [Candidatus Promineifilaceae bacterium]|nr:DUF5317 domain-containing protein [Candidatus Promineifilaceae bacterium]
MILAYAVLLGLLIVLLRAGLQQRTLQPPPLESVWIVFVAFVPQWFAFHNPSTGWLLSDQMAAAILVVTQVLLLFFAWRNRSLPGMWALGGGVALNLLVILANGGLMPVSPEVATRLLPEATHTWSIGERLWMTKDVVLPVEAMSLPWLADRFLLPEGLPLRSAFSLGDVFIAWGAFRLLWSTAEQNQTDDTPISLQPSGETQ